MTRQKVTAAILACAKKLGCVATLAELKKNTGVDRNEIRKHFGNYKAALQECNLEVPERGRKLEIDRLFRDWAEVVRKLKKLPTVFEYEENSSYSEKPLTTRFGTWSQVPGALKLYAERHGLGGRVERRDGVDRRTGKQVVGKIGRGSDAVGYGISGERSKPACLWGGAWKVRACLRSDE
jgi:hypothetical protein